MAQRGAASIDLNRIGRYMVTGLGSGVAWTYWYDKCDGVTDSIISSISSGVGVAAAAGALGIVEHTAISLTLEQFAWCPIFFTVYLIPFSTILNGGSPSNIPNEVKDKLASLLVSNAKVWTFANVLIYNVPAEIRVLTSNVFDVFWAVVCAQVVAECGTGPGFDEDLCAVPPPPPLPPPL